MALTSMHAVLDMMEVLGVESSVSGCKSETEAKSKMGNFYDRLYKPDLAEAKIINGTGELPPPPGFSDEEVEASFDAFLSSLKAG